MSAAVSRHLLSLIRHFARHFRRVPAPGAQLGRFRRDQAVVRALFALRDAAFLDAQPEPRGVLTRLEAHANVFN